MKRLILTIAFLALAATASAQNPFSLINFGVTPVDTNSGNKSAGTLRVVIATDQPNLTTPWNVTFGNTTIAVTNAGTFATQAAQSGTWTVQPGNTANTTAWKVDGSAVTQPVSGTVTANLGTIGGASTAAKQPALGTAGTASADVITIQGIASMTKLLVTPDSVALPANQSVNVAQINGVATTMGNGVSGTGVQRVTIASDSTGQVALAAGSAQIGHLEANQSSNIAQMNGVTVTMGNGVAGTGVQRVAIASDNTAFAVNAQPTPVTSGGTPECYVSSAASTNATNCKASAGQIYGIEAINTTSTLYYLRLYNSSSAPTCSSATGYIRSIPIPHNTGAGGGLSSSYPLGIPYGTGIGFCLTGGGSSTDNTNAATGVYVTVLYK